MTRKLLSSALFAGLAGGIAATVLQLFFVVPLLLEGELYEFGARVHFSASGSPQSVAEAPSVWLEPMRHIGTFGMNLVTFAGFAFVMVAGFALAERQGKRIDARSGAIWGICGFLAVQLAPAFGLPPELPGTIAADLASRQTWWLGTVGATLVGLGLLGYARAPVLLGLGVLLIAAPQLIGAPRLDTYFGVAAPELAAHFVTRALGTAAVAWAILGAVAGAIWSASD